MQNSLVYVTLWVTADIIKALSFKNILSLCLCDEIKSCSRSSRTTVTECCVLKALFSLVWHTCTKMSSVFGTGQSTNSMARIMKANQMSKVCANSHEYPHVEKNQESLWTQFQRYGGPADCHSKGINLRAKRKISGQKEKPHGKKNNPTAKDKRIKNVLSAWKKFCRESFFLLRGFSFCREVFLFAMRLIFLPWQWWATVQRWGKQQALRLWGYSTKSDFSSLIISKLVWNILILLFVFVVSNTARIGTYCNTKPELLFLEC